MILFGGDNLDIRDRVKLLRETLGMSQGDFGNKLSLQRSAISLMERKQRNVTDRTVRDICREFNVDYIWLTTGKGEMFAGEEVEFARLVDRVMDSEDEFVRSFFKTFASLSAEQWELLKEIARKISENGINKNDPE